MTTALKRLRDAGRRPDIESELSDRYHVNWDYASGVDVEDFDVEKSLQNQARFEAIDEDTVETYREAVERGDPFPAVIAYRPRKNAKLQIVDGNHRLVAHQRAGMNIDVYEIASGTRPATIALMTFAFNTRHGRPTSEEERIIQALYLIDNSASVAVASSAVNVPERLVKRALAKRQADMRADEVGADRREWDQLGQAAKSRLLAISTDEGFKDAVHLAYAATMTADEVFTMVALMNENNSRSAAKQRAIVRAQSDALSDRIQNSAGGVLGQTKDRRAITPKARVGMLLGQVLALPTDVGAITRSYIGEERATKARELMDASKRLAAIATGLDASVK